MPQIETSDILTDYFNKLVLWFPYGVTRHQIMSGQHEINPVDVNCLTPIVLLCGTYFDVTVAHACDDLSCEHRTKLPDSGNHAVISLSLAEKLGLEWFEEDEGETLEQGHPEGDKHYFRTISVYLKPA